MAFLIKYARLFEVRILHGFYLDKGDEKNFFDLTDPLDQKFRESVLKRYDLLATDLVIEPSADCRKLLKGHRMVFRPLPTGFIVGIEVREEPLNNGETALAPVNALTSPTHFQFKIKARNRNWSNFSAFRLRPNVPGKFYFTNYEEVDQLQLPSLSLKAGGRSSRYYEMGETVLEGIQLYEAIRGVPANVSLTDANYWSPITDFQYVSYRDQLLLPSRFAYVFTPDDGQLITQASFVLSTATNPNVATIETSGSGPFREYFLNFQALGVPPGKYTLTVTGAPDYEDTKMILIDDGLYEPDLLAVVSIGHQVGLPEGLKLLEDDGALRRIGGQARYPEFELRFPARQTYWRYIAHPNQDTTLAPPQNSDVRQDPASARRLVARRPRPLTLTGSKIKFSDDRLLPNPSDLIVYTDRQDAERKQYSDVYLDKIII